MVSQDPDSLDDSEVLDSEMPEEKEYDPITPLIGSLHLDTHDLAENHDHYLAQAQAD